MRKKTKRIISLLLLLCISLGAYQFGIKNFSIFSDTETQPTQIKRVYETGESTSIITIKEINATSTNGKSVKIPALTQFKAYVYENTVREENTYSFKFRGLDIEYRDKTTDPTIIPYKGVYIYSLIFPQAVYVEPSYENHKCMFEAGTTILIEYMLPNGWMYCVSGYGEAGWLYLKPTENNELDYTVYTDAIFMESRPTAKPSLFYNDIFVYLKQFEGVQGVSIITVNSAEITTEQQDENIKETHNFATIY